MSKCPIELKPMKEWVAENDPTGECRECLLGPVVQWYEEALKESNHQDLAKELIDEAEKDTVTPLTLCEKLDTIKSTVEASVRERLEDFDCAAQAYAED